MEPIVVQYDNELRAVPLGNYNSNELKIFVNLIHLMRGLHKEGDYQQTLTFRQLKRASDYEQSNEHLVKDLTGIIGKIKEVQVDRGSTTWQMPFWNVIEFSRSEQLIEARINTQFMKLVNESKPWTSHQLDQFNSLRSVYSRNIYYLILRSQATNNLKLSFTQFCEQLALPESYRVTRSNINSRVLKPIKEELRTILPDFEIKPVRGDKLGHPIIAYSFAWETDITQETDESQQLDRPTAGDAKQDKYSQLATTWAQYFGQPDQLTATKLKLMADEYGSKRVSQQIEQFGRIMAPTVLKAIESSLKLRRSNEESSKVKLNSAKDANEHDMPDELQEARKLAEQLPEDQLKARNRLLQPFAELTLIQQKLLDILIINIPELGYLPGDRLKISIPNVFSYLGMTSSGASYRRIKEACRTLSQKSLVATPTKGIDGAPGYANARTFRDVDTDDGQIVFSFSEFASPTIAKLRGLYGDDYLSMLASVKSKYTLTLLKQWRANHLHVYLDPDRMPKAVIQDDLDNWQRLFMGPDKRWAPGRFRQNVLNVAIDELNRLYPDVYFALKTCKKGSKAVGYRLDIAPMKSKTDD